MSVDRLPICSPASTHEIGCDSKDTNRSSFLRCFSPSGGGRAPEVAPASLAREHRQPTDGPRSESRAGNVAVVAVFNGGAVGREPSADLSERRVLHLRHVAHGVTMARQISIGVVRTVNLTPARLDCARQMAVAVVLVLALLSERIDRFDEVAARIVPILRAMPQRIDLRREIAVRVIIEQCARTTRPSMLNKLAVLVIGIARYRPDGSICASRLPNVSHS